jgi:hypothetical protein
MSTATELRAQLQAKIDAMPFGMLLTAFDELSAKKDREPAEDTVTWMMAGRVSKELRETVVEFSTDSLISDLRKYMAMDYPTMKATDRSAYWVVSGELENRFPAAALKANTWLDEMTSEDKDAAEPNAWDNYLLGLIEAERAA